MILKRLEDRNVPVPMVELAEAYSHPEQVPGNRCCRSAVEGKMHLYLTGRPKQEARCQTHRYDDQMGDGIPDNFDPGAHLGDFSRWCKNSQFCEAASIMLRQQPPKEE